MNKLEVYLGKNHNVNDFISSRTVVLRLLENILRSGGNFTIDNWFTSLSLVEKLAVNYNIATVHTIKKEKGTTIGIDDTCSSTTMYYYVWTKRK